MLFDAFSSLLKNLNINIKKNVNDLKSPPGREMTIETYLVIYISTIWWF